VTVAGFNDFALGFMVMGSGRIALASFGLLIAGGALSAFLFVSTARTERPRYVLGNAALLLAATLSVAMLIPAPGVIEKGLAGPLWLVWALAQIACGFALWRLAETRSRDAYGHAGAAPLAFVPLVNLWLIFAPRRLESGEADRPGAQMGDMAALVVGIGLLCLSLVVTGIVAERTEAALRGGGAPSEEAWVRFLLDAHGLERTIEVLAAGSLPPAESGASNLTRREAVGTELRGTYVIDGEGYTFSDGFRQVFITTECSAGTDLLLLKAGATIRHDYFDRTGAKLGQQAITIKDCQS